MHVCITGSDLFKTCLVALNVRSYGVYHVELKYAYRFKSIYGKNVGMGKILVILSYDQPVLRYRLLVYSYAWSSSSLKGQNGSIEH